MYKPDVNGENLDDALWFPEYYNWGPSQIEETPTQGGGTAVWDCLQQSYVFVKPPEWWEGCKPGDLVPLEWDVL